MKVGDYGLGTKWSDGHSKDPWCVGWVKEIRVDILGKTRFYMQDENGDLLYPGTMVRFRKLTQEEGDHIVANGKMLETIGVELFKYIYRRRKEKKNDK